MSGITVGIKRMPNVYIRRLIWICNLPVGLIVILWNSNLALFWLKWRVLCGRLALSCPELEIFRHDTTVRLAKRTAEILCPNCLTRFGPHRLPHQPDALFYGCRACRQSRNFLEGIHHIVGVLDIGEPEEQVRQGDTLYVNWLQRRNLFDFDRVEIITWLRALASGLAAGRAAAT